jgi:hypothetical protein
MTIANYLKISNHYILAFLINDSKYL